MVMHPRFGAYKSILAQHRAVATRYDKRALIYQGTINVASIRIWHRDPVT
jgi:transposase